MSTPRMEDLSIIGTTTPVQTDDLPARLAPLYRDGQGQFYLRVQGDSSEDTTFELVGASWVSDQQADGDVALFAAPIAARSGHVLLQSTADEGPEYFPEAELGNRLSELGDHALRGAARALGEADKARAEQLAWYASRAMPERPLPLMLLRALLRGEVPGEQLGYLEKAINELPAEVRARALDVPSPGLESVCSFIAADIAADPSRTETSRQSSAPRPRYLDGLRNDSTFLRKQRRRMASMCHLQPAFG